MLFKLPKCDAVRIILKKTQAFWNFTVNGWAKVY